MVGKQCSSSEFNFEYTQCDGSGERWRIAIPKNHGDICENTIPAKSVNCSFTCQNGHYLDIQSQECRICPAGTYSLGNATRYEEFWQARKFEFYLPARSRLIAFSPDFFEREKLSVWTMCWDNVML